MKYIKRKFRNIPIRRKLFYLIGSLMLFVLGFIAIIITYIVDNHFEKYIYGEMKSKTETILHTIQMAAEVSISNELKNVATYYKKQFESLYQDVLYKKISLEEAQRKAIEIIKDETFSDSGYAFILNEEGQFVYHPAKALLDTVALQTEVLKQITKDKRGYFEYRWQNPWDAQPQDKACYSIPFDPWNWIVAVSTYRTKFAYIIQPEDLKKHIKNIRFGKTGYSYILDSFGNVIFHPILKMDNVWNVTDSDGRKFVQEICQQKNGVIKYKWKNTNDQHEREKIVFFHYLEDYDWIVATSGYEDEFFEIVKTLRYTILIIGIVALFIAFWITHFFGIRLSKPLEQAVAQLKNAHEGNYAIKFSEDSNDEIGLLGYYFNRYMKTIEHYEKTLKTMNENLELLVEERTKELSEEKEKVNTLSELIPICAHCKKVRTDDGYWQQIETYLHARSQTGLTHGICPDCMKEHYGEYFTEEELNEDN